MGRRGGGGGGSGKLSQNVMNFYTDDSPGLKISPVSQIMAPAAETCVQPGHLWLIACLACCVPQVFVICMSLGFILFVTVLHVVGKVGTWNTQ